MAEKLDIRTIHNELAEKEFVVFAGAGVSGANSWMKMLEALAQETPEYDVDLEKRGPAEYPEIAQEIYDKLMEQNAGETYYRIIAEHIKPTGSPYSPQALDILHTAKLVVTINFDNVFDEAYKRYAPGKEDVRDELFWVSIPEINVPADLKEHCVVHLHGRADERYIVLRSDDYKNYYPSVSGKSDGDRAIENCLEEIYQRRTIVFVGVSFEDEYLRNSVTS